MVSVYLTEKIMMKVEFRQMCSSTMTLGREDLYDKIDITDATGTHTFGANRCFSLSIHTVYPTRYNKCSTFIGGFVDSAFFVKSEVNKLSQDQLKDYAGYLSKAIETWEGKFLK